MIVSSLTELAGVTGGTLHGSDARFCGVGTDTRSLRAEQLFVALQGPNFDGNDFVAQAAARGAAGALVSRCTESGIAEVVVADTLTSLGALASAWRQRFDLPVVAVTGSNGKTTVKEMIAAILSRRHPVLATRGNLNNEIGVPLTLLQLDAAHAAAVVEMGANHPGEIERLTAMTAPRVGIVTNAAAAHLEGFGSLAGVAAAKGELFAGLRPEGIAVINRDDAFFARWSEMVGRRRSVTFGYDERADYRPTDVQVRRSGSGAEATLAFTLLTPDGAIDCTLPLAGRHNAINAAAAAAAARSAGAAAADIADGLAGVRGIEGRLRARRALRGALVIDDTYNANPASVSAALDFLVGLPGSGWLVLGDMGELGARARALHQQIGAQARELGVVRLYTLGPLSVAAAEAFGEGACHFDDVNGLVEALRADLAPEVNVLVKASRAMRLERVAHALEATSEG